MVRYAPRNWHPVRAFPQTRVCSLVHSGLRRVRRALERKSRGTQDGAAFLFHSFGSPRDTRRYGSSWLVTRGHKAAARLKYCWGRWPPTPLSPHLTLPSRILLPAPLRPYQSLYLNAITTIY